MTSDPSGGYFVAALLDLAGTTLDDRVSGRPFVFAAFESAFRGVGLEVGPDELQPLRGLDKAEAIRAVLASRRSAARPEDVLAGFRGACEELAGSVRAMPGAIAACHDLRRRGIFVAAGTGLPQAIAERLVAGAGLPVDYVTSGERAGGGRPGPEMARDVLAHVGASGRLLKVGDTPNDVLEGRAASAYTVAVASGTHASAELSKLGPDAVLASIAELPRHLTEVFGTASPRAARCTISRETSRP